MNHELYMQRCFELALSGAGKVATNPLVGSLLVHEGTIIAEGFHSVFGGAHAEVNVLSRVNNPAILQNSTLYVNLEPCSHHGKTPPCTSLILEKEIPKVVICNSDPNPKVNGEGIKILKRAGIEVVSGVLEQNGLELNRRFFTFHNHKRPYVILKWAQSADGFVAPLHFEKENNGITWISNLTSRLLVHKWRSEEQAILVGKTTAMADNPKLNVRGFIARDPLRIVIDPNLELPHHLNIFNKKSKTIIFNLVKNQIFENLEYVKIGSRKKIISALLSELYLRDIQSVMIEGGTFTLNSFMEEGFWDEMRVFTGGISLKNGIKAPSVRLIPEEQQLIGTDLLQIFRNRNNNKSNFL